MHALPAYQKRQWIVDDVCHVRLEAWHDSLQAPFRELLVLVDAMLISEQLGAMKFLVSDANSFRGQQVRRGKPLSCAVENL